MGISMPSPPDKNAHQKELKQDNSPQVREKIRLWIQNCVIEWNLCPFAKAPFYSGRVQIEVYQGSDPQELIEYVLTQAYRLLEWQKTHQQNHTTLIATPLGWSDFEEYWECVGWLEDCFAGLGLEGKLQIASFHPAYQFEGESGVGMYSNRSPYPLFHLLLEDEVERQIEGFTGVDQIGESNRNTLEKLGLPIVQARLKQCGWTPPR